MREKSEFVAFRAEPDDVQAIKSIAKALGSGSMSAALRWAVRNAPRPGAQPVTEQPQPDREAAHA